MKASEIVASMPKWANATSDEIVVSPAWSMPCRFGENSCTMRLDAVRPSDALDVAITLEDESHVLSIVDTPCFEELHRLWASRTDVPEPILLALVEKECANLLQLVENATRRQLKVVGLAAEVPEDRLCARLCSEDGSDLLSFALTATPSIVRTFGRLAYIDVDNPCVRDVPVSATTELAAFVLPAADLSSLAVGDALLLPEVGTVAPRLIVEGRFAVDGNGVSPYKDDGMLLVLDANPHEITLGDVLDHAKSPAAPKVPSPSGLRLESSGRTVAFGRLDSLAGQNAFIVESLG
jgi:hypothetical protein